MTQMWKWAIMVILVTLIMLLSLFLYNTHEKNIRESQNINTLVETSNVGQLRTSFDEGLNEVGTIQADATVNEIISQVAQRYSALDVKIDYVFFDKDGKTYSEDEAKSDAHKITGVQYKVSVLDDKGEVESTSTQRLVLNKKVGVN